MATAAIRSASPPFSARHSRTPPQRPLEDKTSSKDSGAATGALIGAGVGLAAGVYVFVVSTGIVTVGSAPVTGPAAPALGTASGLAAGIGTWAALTGLGAAIGGAIGTLVGDDDPTPPPATNPGASGDPGGSIGIGPFTTGDGTQGSSDTGQRGGSDSGQDGNQGSSSSGGGHCFLGGTPVILADGSTLPIEQIPLGTLVVAQDPDSGDVTAQPTTATFTHHVHSTLLLHLSDGSTLHTTRQHRFFVPEHGFLAAGRLTPGMSVVTLSNQYLTVLGSTPVESEAVVYNLEVANAHTYFVGQQGVWVHNKKIDDPPD